MPGLRISWTILKTVIYDWSGYSAGRNSAAFTKKKIADKRNLPYAVVDIDDTYAADGSVSKSANFNIHFPTLLKYEDANFENKGLPTNSQVGAMM